MRARTYVMTSASALVAALLAGCAGDPSEASEPEDPLDGVVGGGCGEYESLHYEQAPEADALRASFEAAGWGWSQRTDRIAEATGPTGGVVVLSHEPGPSGQDLVASARGTDAHALAIAASAIVNYTSDDARLDRWIVDNDC